MAEEEKKVEETTEAPVEEAKEEKKSKKKDKKSVDVNALVGKAKDGINQGSSKLTAVVKEADDKKKMLIFLIIIALEVILSILSMQHENHMTVVLPASNQLHLQWYHIDSI